MPNQHASVDGQRGEGTLAVTGFPALLDEARRSQIISQHGARQASCSGLANDDRSVTSRELGLDEDRCCWSLVAGASSRSLVDAVASLVGKSNLRTHRNHLERGTSHMPLCTAAFLPSFFPPFMFLARISASYVFAPRSYLFSSFALSDFIASNAPRIIRHAPASWGIHIAS